MGRSSEVVDTTYQRDRISATVITEVANVPLGKGKRIAKSKARNEARNLIDFRDQKVEYIENVDTAGVTSTGYKVIVKHKNPSKEFGSREVRRKEQELWDEFRSISLDEYKPDVISVTQIAQNIGLHEEKSREIVKVWQREGLVDAFHNYNQARITKKGEKTPLLPPS